MRCFTILRIAGRKRSIRWSSPASRMSLSGSRARSPRVHCEPRNYRRLARLGVERNRGASVKSRWALVVMGTWIMGSICMSVVASENFYTIDRLLDTSTNVEFHGAVQKLGHAPARDLLRYLSSELNRLYFQT